MNTLIIRHETVEEAVQSFGEHLGSDDEVSHVVAFTDADELGRLLTERRMEIIETIMTEEPDSIRHLAEIVDRERRIARKDVQILSKRDIVEVVEEGQTKKPRIPYENVRIEVDFPITETA